jgi:hypothetical protein
MASVSFEPEGYKLALLVALTGGAKSIGHIVWGILASTKRLFHIAYSMESKCMFFVRDLSVV